jgi:cyclopropane-fatty-acyl-phospholipid synthase
LSILANATNALARRTFLSAVARLKVGKLTVEMPDGTSRTFDSGFVGPSGVLQVKSNDFFGKVIFHGEIGFGEAYQARLCDSPDLVTLIRLAILNRREVNLNSGPLKILSKRKNIRLHRGRKNTEEQSKHNIHDHYDLGNDFFRLFLDDTLTYSSAVFKTPEQDLADAQRNKYRRIAEGAKITQDDHVLEIGSGWGGFAIFAAGTYGCRVTSLTISKEQFDLAAERIAEAGLSELIDVQMLDYRQVIGTYDKIVSIEMFEAVGAEYFEMFFLKCSEVLRPGGLLSMQVITVPDEDYEAQLNGANWIQKYIFPGGILPSVEEMKRCNIHTGLTLTSADDIGEHYATTLHQWRDRFWEHMDEVQAQGFDDHFVQTWDYYLAVCEAGFITRNTGDAQVVFEKAS